MKSPMRVAFEGRAAVVIPLHACGWGYANPGCKLHRAAARCGVPRLCDFFAPRGAAGDLPWFPVADGLASIAGLRAELGERPGSVCDAGCSLRDLAELERVLRAAPAGRFRLSIVRHGEQPAAVTEDL
jgi:hypothetical protein